MDYLKKYNNAIMTNIETILYFTPVLNKKWLGFSEQSKSRRKVLRILGLNFVVAYILHIAERNLKID